MSRTKKVNPPLDLHEWISFEDDTTQRTWVFDATFLRSNWNCIFGNGCQGVLDGDASHLAQGCCSYGAHFIDDDDVQTVVDSSKHLKKRHWQFKKEGTRDGFLEAIDGVTTTRLVDDACIFLNRPGFEGGIGCAFHHLAAETGEHEQHGDHGDVLHQQDGEAEPAERGGEAAGRHQQLHDDGSGGHRQRQADDD